VIVVVLLDSDSAESVLDKDDWEEEIDDESNAERLVDPADIDTWMEDDDADVDKVVVFWDIEVDAAIEPEELVGTEFTHD